MSDDFPVLGSKESKRAPNKNNKPVIVGNNQKPQQQPKQPFVQQQQQQPQPPVVAPLQQNKAIVSIADIGANLADRSFERDLNAVLIKSGNRGVNHVIITGTSIRSTQKALEIIGKYKDNVPGGVKLYCTAGVHPHEAERAHPNSIDDLRSMALKNPGVVVSLGECGLDFDRNFSTPQSQCDMFEKQIQLAIELKMPLFIHERAAHRKFVEIVSKYCNAGTMPKSVVHCFTGTRDEVELYLKMGFYIGLTGVITQQKRGQTLRDILSAKIIPLNRLMIETDAPYMTPHDMNEEDRQKQPQHSTHGGKQHHQRNEPAYLTYVLATIATCYGISLEEAAQHTLNTTKEFFNI
ncbi:tatD-related DNAse [Heterostelium album PN500]|uniref:TatD-related DNAse n=1 Tax=Heterostelium pallidum (strain ATCC 26659 / Pp 5 / PN500) TaxID=670386 RepID=D3BMJ3_HETP5|nr:tatD-related DNAse [Heterostelium album PN500]EFA77205.1 tatD-related DNAse [Heterostelium album PN500]|eukprot:XP_020429334.1 tatD-related DNAse [Heterostelium album PN500]